MPITSEVTHLIGSAEETAALLLERALAILLRVLGQSNEVSPQQRQAVREMLTGMAEQSVGINPGRYAYGLPCGGGKTQGVIALITASHELGLGLTFAVATSQIEALCGMYRDLLEAGIPGDMIGLRHSCAYSSDPEKYGPGTGYASEPATPGSDGYPILLLSHMRLQNGDVAEYRGRPRSLLIWDESLLSTEATIMSVKSLREALNAGGNAPDLVPYIHKVLEPVEEELARLSQNEKAEPRTLSNLLSTEEMATGQALTRSLRSDGRYVSVLKKDLNGLWALLERDISVVTTDSGDTGDGILRYEVTVADSLENIAILDASHVIRDLTQADDSILDRTTEAMRNYKSYSAVTVRQIEMSTGKRTLASGTQASLAMAKEVQRAIEQTPSNESVLVFTFKAEEKSLRRNLARLGIDPRELVDVDGVPRDRIEIVTWGQETSRNDLRHCAHVIMAGVLRRSSLDLAASLTGQRCRGHSPQRNPKEALQHLTLSEMAHCVLQGMNRGSCRLMDSGGQARAMTLTILVSRASGLRDMLVPVLRDITWDYGEPQGKALSRIKEAGKGIAEYLRALPESKVSIRRLHTDCRISLGEDARREAVDDALLRLILKPKGTRWKREGRSLVREGG